MYVHIKQVPRDQHIYVKDMLPETQVFLFIASDQSLFFYFGRKQR